MAKRIAERVVLDTNVLLAATDTGRGEHDQALAALNEWPAQGTTLYTSGQILREYLAVATRPQSANGLGLSRADSVANARSLAQRMRTLDETDKVRRRLWDIIGTVDCAGKQVHDANVVATMLAAGVETLVTMNVGDFMRFDDLISVEALPR